MDVKTLMQPMQYGDMPVRFSKGETVFMPAGIGRCLIIGDTSVLKIRC